MLNCGNSLLLHFFQDFQKDLLNLVVTPMQTLSRYSNISNKNDSPFAKLTPFKVVVEAPMLFWFSLSENRESTFNYNDTINSILIKTEKKYLLVFIFWMN